MFTTAKELKEGKYVLIDEVPCRIVSIDSSKPGKHGSAKMRIVAMGVFNNQKKNLLVPSSADVEVPIIERKSVQVLSVSGNSVQVMDPKTYEIYDLAIPDELKGAGIEAGKELEIMEAMGQKAILRIR
ncbi:translation initiation factor IF-5A [Candidatus Micrarchaeota archaeon]|nr:translation initiation factor IF-5A [Candidatus Micrarchaeota archaeon]